MDALARKRTRVNETLNCIIHIKVQGGTHDWRLVVGCSPSCANNNDNALPCLRCASAWFRRLDLTVGGHCITSGAKPWGNVVIVHLADIDDGPSTKGLHISFIKRRSSDVARVLHVDFIALYFSQVDLVKWCEMSNAVRCLSMPIVWQSNVECADTNDMTDTTQSEGQHTYTRISTDAFHFLFILATKRMAFVCSQKIGRTSLLRYYSMHTRNFALLVTCTITENGSSELALVTLLVDGNNLGLFIPVCCQGPVSSTSNGVNRGVSKYLKSLTTRSTVVYADLGVICILSYSKGHRSHVGHMYVVCIQRCMWVTQNENSPGILSDAWILNCIQKLELWWVKPNGTQRGWIIVLSIDRFARLNRSPVRLLASRP